MCINDDCEEVDFSDIDNHAWLATIALWYGCGLGEKGKIKCQSVRRVREPTSFLLAPSPLYRIISLILIFFGDFFVFFAILGVQTYRLFGSMLGLGL